MFSLVNLKMAAGNARIGQLAPDFTAKAVMPDGMFKDLTLSSYRGTTEPVSHLLLVTGHALMSQHCFEQIFIYTTKDRN